jgi:hypothetical protein
MPWQKDSGEREVLERRGVALRAQGGDRLQPGCSVPQSEGVWRKKHPSEHSLCRFGLWRCGVLPSSKKSRKSGQSVAPPPGREHPTLMSGPSVVAGCAGLLALLSALSGCRLQTLPGASVQELNRQALLRGEPFEVTSAAGRFALRLQGVNGFATQGGTPALEGSLASKQVVEFEVAASPNFAGELLVGLDAERLSQRDPGEQLRFEVQVGSLAPVPLSRAGLSRSASGGVRLLQRVNESGSFRVKLGILVGPRAPALADVPVSLLVTEATGSRRMRASAPLLLSVANRTVFHLTSARPPSPIPSASASPVVAAVSLPGWDPDQTRVILKEEMGFPSNLAGMLFVFRNFQTVDQTLNLAGALRTANAAREAFVVPRSGAQGPGEASLTVPRGAVVRGAFKFPFESAASARRFGFNVDGPPVESPQGGTVTPAPRPTQAPSVAAPVPTGTAFSEILSLNQSRCVGCHTGRRPSGGVRLTSYAEIVAQVRAGSPDESPYFTSTESRMPPGSGLSAADRSKIRSWIEGGARNN